MLVLSLVILVVNSAQDGRLGLDLSNLLIEIFKFVLGIGRDLVALVEISQVLRTEVNLVSVVQLAIVVEAINHVIMGLLKYALFIIILLQDGLPGARGSRREGSRGWGRVGVPALLGLCEDAEGLHLLVHLCHVLLKELVYLH